MASPLELQRHNDRTPDTKALEGPKDLPGVDRSSLLAGLKLLPEQKQTANLHEVKVEGAKAVQLAAVGKVPADSALKTLQSADATAQQKIEAVSKLYDTMPKDAKGRVHITLHDGDKDKQFEISKEKLGHGVSLTHLTYRDENGHNHPVLRGVERNGQIDQQNDKSGNKVDFQGDWWSKHAGDSAISKFAPSTDAPLPPRRPDHLGQPAPDNAEREAPLPPRRPDHLGQPAPDNAEREAPLPPRRPAHFGQPAPDNVEREAPLPPRRPDHLGAHGQGKEPADSQTGPEHKPERKAVRRPDSDEASGHQNGEYVNRSDLHKFWVVQPSKSECGSSAQAMAISKITGRPPLSGSEIHQLSRENGTFHEGAFPHGPGNRNMEAQLKAHGVNAKTFDFGANPHQEMNQLDAELAKGNSAVAYIRNPATGHGHFIFVAGKTDSGHYLVGNSGKHTFGNAPPVDRETLQSWMLGQKRGSPYFVSVSKYA